MRVVKIAQDLFIDEGVAATSVNRIAKEAGLTPMSVYRYFGTKDGLVIAAWRDALAQFYEKNSWSATPGEAKICRPALKNTLPAWRSTQTPTRVSEVVCLHARDAQLRDGGKYRDRAEYKRCVLAVYRQGDTYPGARCAARGIADGSIRPDIDIHMIYQILVNAYTGTNIYDGTKYPIDPFETLRNPSPNLGYFKKKRHLSLCNLYGIFKMTKYFAG